MLIYSRASWSIFITIFKWNEPSSPHRECVSILYIRERGEQVQIIESCVLANVGYHNHEAGCVSSLIFVMGLY